MRTLHSLHTIDIKPGQQGYTVRKGTKWADAKGKKIELCECLHGGHQVVGEGVVLNVWSGKFKDVPQNVLQNEHEESARTYQGLLASMRRAYGPGFSEDDEVTYLQYQRKA